MSRSRTAKAGVNAAVVVLAIGAGVFASLKPWNAYREQRAAAERQKDAMRSAERERADLLRKQSEAGSAVGKEIHARELGYVKQGQQPADSP